MSVLEQEEFNEYSWFINNEKLENIIYMYFEYVWWLTEQDQDIDDGTITASLRRDIIIHLWSICEAILRCIIIIILRHWPADYKKEIWTAFEKKYNANNINILSISDKEIEIISNKTIKINDIFKDDITFSTMVEKIKKINMKWIDSNMLKNIGKLANDRNHIHIHKLYLSDVSLPTKETITNYIENSMKLLKHWNKISDILNKNKPTTPL